MQAWYLPKIHLLDSNSLCLPSNKGFAPKGGVCPGWQFIRITFRDHWQRIIQDFDRPEGFLRAGIHRLVLEIGKVQVPGTVTFVVVRDKWLHGWLTGGSWWFVKDMEKEHMRGRRTTFFHETTTLRLQKKIKIIKNPSSSASHPSTSQVQKPYTKS